MPGLFIINQNLKPIHEINYTRPFVLLQLSSTDKNELQRKIKENQMM